MILQRRSLCTSCTCSEVALYQITFNIRLHSLNVASTKTWEGAAVGEGVLRVHTSRQEVKGGNEPGDLMLQVSLGPLRRTWFILQTFPNPVVDRRPGGGCKFSLRCPQPNKGQTQLLWQT